MRIRFAIASKLRPAVVRPTKAPPRKNQPIAEGLGRFRLLVRFGHAFLWTLALALLTGNASAAAKRGQLGANLADLGRFYTPPQISGESNHYVDMWDGRGLREIVQSAGLTNNNALFVNSHGKGIAAGRNKLYAFYPHRKLLSYRQTVPHFSVGDLAGLLGPKATTIQNIVVAGCDNEKAFDAQEMRKYFPNATNITHVVSGQPGYQPMFLQAIFSPSHNIETLYEVAERNPSGATQYRITTTPIGRAVKLSPYVAELFRPGMNQPYRMQIAGRELLQPLPASTPFPEIAAFGSK